MCVCVRADQAIRVGFRVRQGGVHARYPRCRPGTPVRFGRRRLRPGAVRLRRAQHRISCAHGGTPHAARTAAIGFGLGLGLLGLPGPPPHRYAPLAVPGRL